MTFMTMCCLNDARNQNEREWMGEKRFWGEELKCQKNCHSPESRNFS